MLFLISEVKDYQKDILIPVTAQPSTHASVVASILEHHTAELTAAQEWENEWNSQGLLSRLTPQVNHLIHHLHTNLRLYNIIYHYQGHSKVKAVGGIVILIFFFHYLLLKLGLNQKFVWLVLNKRYLP